MADCKDKSCKAKAKIITFLNERPSKTYLLIAEDGKSSQKSPTSKLFIKDKHKKNCKFDVQLKEDPFVDSDLLSLIKRSELKPTTVIKKYINIPGKKLENTAKIRQKISSIRSKDKAKSKLPEQMVYNMNELKSFIEQNSPSHEQFSALGFDRPFVCGQISDTDNITLIMTTKNLLENYYKQSQCSSKFLCLDGTYRLNNLRYPSLILGTVDIERKFHLGII